jgi:hypothetical protein
VTARNVLGLVVAVVVALGLVTARAVMLGEARLSDADAAIRRQDPMAAIDSARQAARWYVPGAPHVSAAYGRLVHLARTAEATGDRETALAAWRAIRSAAVETAWVLSPHESEVRASDIAVARLASEGPRPLLARDETPDKAERRIAALLAREDTPRTPWIVALAAGLLTLVGGAIAAAARGVLPDGSLDLARARIPAVIALAGICVYAVAVWRA